MHWPRPGRTSPHGPPGRKRAASCRGHRHDVDSQGTRARRRRDHCDPPSRQWSPRSLETLGRIDILVNNAGVNIRGPIEELSEDDWDTVVDTNLKGPWLCCRAVAPDHEGSRNRGRVINVSSMLGEISLPGRTPYASSKGGLTLLTKTLALEWAKDGINVNALCPGPFATEINTPLLNDPAARAQWKPTCPWPAGATRSSWGRPRSSSRPTPRAS